MMNEEAGVAFHSSLIIPHSSLSFLRPFLMLGRGAPGSFGRGRGGGEEFGRRPAREDRADEERGQREQRGQERGGRRLEGAPPRRVSVDEDAREGDGGHGDDEGGGHPPGLGEAPRRGV